MSLINIISAIGNNSSIYPLFVRDCMIENPIKVRLTYKQNRQDSKQMAINATRERAIDEYGTSAVWLGGIPVMNKICDWVIKKAGYNPDINPKLFTEGSKQGLRYNIEKFKNLAPNEVKDLEKVLANKSKYQKILAGKFVASTAIPIALMGFILPKMNFKLTEKIRSKQVQKENNISQKNGNVVFKGISAALSNMSTVNKMAVTDCGLTVGRVKTGRNRNEKIEMGFKMLGSMFLNYVAPIWIAFGLDKFSGKVFNTNVNLDPKILNEAENLANDFELPKGSIIEFLDKKPQSKFSKLCEEYCGIKYLKNGIRDPRVFVDEKKLNDFKTEIECYIKEVKTSGNTKKYAKKALAVKSANILTNVCLSSFLLAMVLPKVTFLFREKMFGEKPEPGLL